MGERTAEEWGRIAVREEWGRIAVSLPGWKWMPGMYAVASSGSTRVASVIPRWWLQTHAAVPNPDDPATAGCLLALLGAEVVVYAPRGLDDFDPDWVINYRVDTHTTITGRGLSLGRACIAAAAALGRWPGGTS